MTEKDLDHERNRRLFGAMVGWLPFEGRRPGMLGTAVSFSGHTRSGPAALHRVIENDDAIGAAGEWDSWELTNDSGATRVVPAADVIRMVGEGEFFPGTVDVVPDLAPILFMEAVHQAEISLGRLAEAGRHLDGMEAAEEPAPTTWVLASSELDRSVRASIAAIVLAIAAGEAQINTWAESRGGWRKDEDGLGVAEKCRVLADRVGSPIDLGSAPHQDLKVATKRRNALVHSMPVPQRMAATGARAPIPGISISVEARATCLAVRSSFVDLAGRLDVAPPGYLAYCPPAPADDDQAWATAIVMTGTRRDPVFPTVTERLAAREEARGSE